MMDSEVTLQVDTSGLGFRGAQPWSGTLCCTLRAPSGMGYAVSFRAAQSWGDIFWGANSIVGGHHWGDFAGVYSVQSWGGPLGWTVDALPWALLSGRTPLAWTLGVDPWRGLHLEWTSLGWTLEMDTSGLGLRDGKP